MSRYPTTRELVAAALTGSTHDTRKPTQKAPNYALPCEDLDGNPSTLLVVALGGRMAVVHPNGQTAVLSPPAVAGS